MALNLNIPLIEGKSRSYQVKAAQAEVEMQAANVKRLEQQISLDVWKTYQDLRTLSAGLKAADDLMESAIAVHDRARAGYRLGDAMLLDVMVAQATLANARKQQVQTVTSWHAARIRFAASLGKLGFSLLETTQ